MHRILPDSECPEPVYVYDNPGAHPIELSGIFLDQKSAYRIRMITTTPESIDRLCKVKTLEYASNYDYSTAWTGAVNDFQRKVNVDDMSKISNWWGNAEAMSPTTPLCWLPAAYSFNDSEQNKTSITTIYPSIWCFSVCPECGADATQYGYTSEHVFDCCRLCWEENQVCTRPGMIIDGQHRIRGMSKVNANDDHKEQIFTTFLSEAAPKGIHLGQAARLFIEINAGAKPLDQLHKDYLSSHFELFEYSNVNRRSAYRVGVDLNIPSGTNEWAEDTGANASAGRVSLMPGGNSADYLDVSPMATKGTIEEWVMRTADSQFEVPAYAGGGTVSKTPYNWTNPNLITQLVGDLRNLLAAVTNIWQGSAGPKTMPAWRTDRGRPHGHLQQKRVFRVFMNMLPIISSRLDEQGIARTRSNFEIELAAINNISFTGAWEQYLTGDTGVTLVTRILTQLYERAPYPTSASYWASLPTWFSSEHDPIVVTGFNATPDQVEFNTLTTCNICPSGPITSPVSLIGVNESSITITNATTGVTHPSRTFSIKERGQLNTITYDELSIPKPNVGDTIEMKISVSKKFSTVLVDAPMVTDTV